MHSSSRLEQIRKELKGAQNGTHKELLELKEALRIGGLKELEKAHEEYEVCPFLKQNVLIVMATFSF